MKFIDIHTHTLYGLDDGSTSLRETLSMLEMAIEYGTTDLICTPHYTYFRDNTPDKTIPLFENLKKEASHLDITLHLGNEMRFTKPTYDAFQSGDFNTLAGSDYTLIDFPFSKPLESPVELLKAFQVYNQQLIIAHPERHDYIRDKNLLKTIKQQDVKFQVNTTSILGLHGRDAQEFAFWLLDNRLVDFIASDTHNTSNRPPNLRQTYDFLSDRLDQEYLQQLFYENAKKLIIDA